MPDNGSVGVAAGKSVLVIGYGPSGITAVEQFQEQGFEVTCFEARSQPGGVWVHEPGPAALEMSFDCDGRPIMQSLSESKGRPPCLSSAMYDCLHTNLPNPLMAYRGHPFHTKIDLFPSRSVVADYLTDVAKLREACVRYNILVTRCRYNDDKTGRRWLVDYQDLKTQKTESQTFDYVVAASGHYSVPYVPYYDGLWLWKGDVSHGRSYRSPEVFKGKNLLVVGARASGYDITRDISEHLFATEGHQRKIYQSVRDTSNMFAEVSGPSSAIVQVVPAIKAFSENEITLVDGTVLKDVDSVVFTTGYLFSFPFFNMEDEPFKSHPLYQTPPAGPDPAASSKHSGKSTYPAGGLALHNLDSLNLFYHPDPTLAFLAVHYLVVPMPLAQIQARYIARQWSKGTLDLKPGPDGLSDSGWASDQDVRKSIFMGGEDEFDYGDALITALGEGGTSEFANGDLHQDGTFTLNPKWRRGLRVTANILKKATLGY